MLLRDLFEHLDLPVDTKHRIYLINLCNIQSQSIKNMIFLDMFIYRFYKVALRKMQ